MEFRLLGPLEVLGAEGLVTLDRGKPLGLLELLLLHAGEVVPSEQLLEALWGEEPPPTAEHAVEVYVSRLRRALGNERIETRTPGYRLRLADGDLLDLDRFLALTGEAAAAMRDGRPAEATVTLAQAEALWRGPALSELSGSSAGQAEITRLDELRMSATESRIDARLATGAAHELLPELERLVAAHPFRERLRAQLMLALYRSGRQADALAAFQRARVALNEELGVEPAAALQALQVAILQQDQALDLQPPARGPVAVTEADEPGGTAGSAVRPGPPSGVPGIARGGRAVGALAAAAIIALGGVVIAVWLGSGGSGPPAGPSASPSPAVSVTPSGSGVAWSPTTAEAELLGLVPTAVRESCERTESGEGRTPSASVSLRCELPFGSLADVAWYERFDTPQALAIAFGGTLPADLREDTCDATTTDAVGRWTSGETFDGSVGCFTSDGAAWIAWTYERGPNLILARARQEGVDAASVATLWEWWYEIAVLLR